MDAGCTPTLESCRCSQNEMGFWASMVVEDFGVGCRSAAGVELEGNRGQRNGVVDLVLFGIAGLRLNHIF